ncbi:MAG: zinc-binding dehydrogenase [Armatimonadota bacterium]|nr:MAG: zinc-binding dehydrogenase [Armatimonadota bacterium]
MKAAVFRDKEDVRIEEVATPEPGRGEALVRNMACGICGSDKGLWMNPGPKPGIHGHEAAGIVEKIGAEVGDVRPGDRVTVMAVKGCGECVDCRRGEFVCCEEGPQGLTGGFAEYQAVPAELALPLPDGLPFEAGCLLTDALGTPARAVRRSGIEAGEMAAVYGCGPIGLNAVQMLKAYGALVIALDPIAYRVEAARELGADFGIDLSRDSAVNAIRAITRVGADYVFECSGHGGKEALASVRRAGKVAFVGECPKLEISPSEDLIRRHVEVFGTWYLTRTDYIQNVRLVESGAVDPMRIVTHILPFEEIGRGFDVFCNHREQALKVVLRFGGEGI